MTADADLALFSEDELRQPSPAAIRAEADMRAAGYEPLVAYPGKNNIPWACTHVSCGRTVTPRLGNIRSGFGGCRPCATTARAAGRRLDPEAAAEVMRAAGLVPLEPYPGSAEPWRCLHVACGREGTPAYANVRSGQGACRSCALEKGGLARRTPEDEAVAVMRAAGLEPLVPYPGVHERWRSTHLACGQEVEPTLGSVRRGGEGCLPCGNVRSGLRRRIATEEDALAAATSAGLTPLEPWPGTVDARWRCLHEECGAEVEVTLAGLRAGRMPCRNFRGDADGERAQNACRDASRKAVGQRLSHDPVLAAHVMRECGLEPQVPYPGSVDLPWPSIHVACGRLVQPRFASIRSGGQGCTTCGAARRGEASRMPSDVAHEIVRNAGLEPLEPYPGTANLPWTARHLACGETVTVLVAKIQAGQSGCKPCATVLRGQARKLGLADEAEQVMRAADLVPAEPYPGALSRWRCVHLPCGREVTPTYSNVKQARSICPYCATHGFDLDRPTLLYVITDWEAHKIGVAGVGTKRLSVHRSHGWEVYRRRLLSTGADALLLERAVLRHLREVLRLPSHYTAAEMPQRGETETVGADRISLPDLWRLVEDAAAGRL